MSVSVFCALAYLTVPPLQNGFQSEALSEAAVSLFEVAALQQGTGNIYAAVRAADAAFYGGLGSYVIPTRRNMSKAMFFYHRADELERSAREAAVVPRPLGELGSAGDGAEKLPSAVQGKDADAGWGGVAPNSVQGSWQGAYGVAYMLEHYGDDSGSQKGKHIRNLVAAMAAYWDILPASGFSPGAIVGECAARHCGLRHSCVVCLSPLSPMVLRPSPSPRAVLSVSLLFSNVLGQIAVAWAMNRCFCKAVVWLLL